MNRTNNREKAEKLATITDKLRDSIVIVEGKKDERALYSLGLKNIIAINGKTLINIADKVSKLYMKESLPVVILTDFDQKGRKLAAKLQVLLQRLKIHPNERLRKMFMSFGKNNVESLVPHNIENLSAGKNNPADINRSDYHVKISTNIYKIHSQGSHKSERSCREA